MGGVRGVRGGGADPGRTRQCRHVHGAGDAPERRSLRGFTLRLFDPETGTWRIWWASIRFPGVLDRPVEGRFDGDRGEFQCDDVIGGKRVKVRYAWRVLSPTTNRWEQSFSYDDGVNWRTNWISEGTQVS